MKKFRISFLLIVALIAGPILLSSCQTIDNAAEKAAEFDNSINAGAVKLDRHMRHYQG